MDDFLRYDGVSEHDEAIDLWFSQRESPLGAMARGWWLRMRECGDDVRELLHDGSPIACVGDAPFAYVNVFKAHVNVGFFQGASLADPADLLEGGGRYMRHVKLRPDKPVSDAALQALIDAAYADMRARVAAA